MLRYLGQFKYRAMRLSGYITLFNTAVLIYGFGWHNWYLLAFSVIALAYVFEKNHGIPGEMDVAWKSSAEWMNFKKEWDEFRRLHSPKSQ